MKLSVIRTATYNIYHNTTAAEIAAFYTSAQYKLFCISETTTWQPPENHINPSNAEATFIQNGPNTIQDPKLNCGWDLWYPSNAAVTFIQSTRTRKSLKIFLTRHVGIHWKLLLCPIRWVSICQGFGHFPAYFASFCKDQISRQQYKG